MSSEVRNQHVDTRYSSFQSHSSKPVTDPGLSRGDLDRALPSPPSNGRVSTGKSDPYSIVLTRIHTMNKDYLESVLEPGDLLFKRRYTFFESTAVQLGQWLVSDYSEDGEAHKYSHVLIYTGNGELAEAIPGGVDQVRRIALSHPSFSPNDGSTACYHVVRLVDSDLARRSASYARSITKLSTPENPVASKAQYSKLAAIASSLASSSMTSEALSSAVQAATSPPEGAQDYDEGYAFCSQFVSTCIQTAEVARVIENLREGELEATEDVEDGWLLLARHGEIETSKQVEGDWVYVGRENASNPKVLRTVGRTLEVMNLNPRLTTPQDLWRHTLRNPKQFVTQFSIENTPEASAKADLKL